MLAWQFLFLQSLCFPVNYLPPLYIIRPLPLSLALVLQRMLLPVCLLRFHISMGLHKCVSPITLSHQFNYWASQRT